MIYKSHDLKRDDNQSLPRQRADSLNRGGAPRGILKRNSSSSSTDSETVRFHQNFEPKSKIVSPVLTIHERISEKEHEHSLEDDSSSNSLEPLKHVRFSAVKDELPQSPGLIHGREVGEFSVLESDRLKNGAEDAEKHFCVTDELSHVEPEPSQVPDCSSKDHQQGKALRAKTSSCSGPYATEIRKTTDDSISKVLDWFNRSSHSDGSEVSLQHPRGTESREKTDSEAWIALALVMDDTSQKENGSKALFSTKVELTPIGSDSMFQVEENMLPSGNCRDGTVNIKPKSIHLSPQGKESPGILQPFEIYSPNQENKTVDYSQVSKNIGEGIEVLPPTNSYSYSIRKGSDAEDHVPCNVKGVGSLGEAEPELHVYEKNRGKSEVNFDSSTIVRELSLKDSMKAEGECKGRDTYILKASLEPEDTEPSPGAANNRSPWKKPEVQLQEAGEVPESQVQREKYKRVSDRISFWEGEKAATKLTHKEPTTSFSQERPSAKACQPVTSMDSLSTGHSKHNNQITVKQVVLDKDGQVAHLSSFYSSKTPKETRPQTSGPSKNYLSSDQSVKVSLFQNKTTEPVKRLPVTESLRSEKDISSLPLQHPSNVGSEIHTPLEENRPLVGESNPSFKVMSLKERMDEPSTEQVYNHSQFENLRKFWDLEANPNNQDNIEKKTTTTSQINSVPFNSQKHKDFSDSKSSGKNTHEREMLLSQKKVPAREEIEKLNSEGTLQVLPDETTFPLRPPRKFTHQLPGNESSKKNMGKNTEWFVTPAFKEEKDYSDQEIQESIVKTTVLSKDYKDTFNDSLQKLLAEAASPVIQPPGGKFHEKQVLEPGVSENTTWPQKTDFTNTEKEAKRPKEIINEHVDKTVPPPKVNLNPLTTSLDKLLKEATGNPPSPLQTKCEPITTSINSESAESRVFEKGIEQSQNTSAYQREIIAPFPERGETLGNTALSQEAQSGECQLNTESSSQMAAEGSHLLDQPSDRHRKGFWGDMANCPQDMPSSRDAHLAPQDKALPSPREISETIEKVTLPPKPALNDVNAVLQKLLREALLSYPVGKEAVSGKVKAEFPEGVRVAGNPQNSLGVVSPRATMEFIVPGRKDFYSSSVVPDETHEVGSYLAAHMSPSEQTLSSSGSTVAQDGKVLPKEVTEIVRETIIQPKSELLEFNAGLEKLLKETVGTSCTKYDSDTGTLYSARLIGSTEVPRQAASEFHPKEIKETIKKSEAPSVTESAFDTGFEKLLKEMSNGSCYQLQVSAKEGAPGKEPSQSKQARFLGKAPPLYWTASEASEMTLKRNIFKSQVNQRDKVLRRGKAVTDLSVDLCGSESGVEIPGTSPLPVDHEVGTFETIKPPGDRDSESEVAAVPEGSFQEPGFKEAPEAINVPRNMHPIPLPANKENFTKTSKVELILASSCKRQEKKEENEGFSDSDFSDGNIGSYAESWRDSSSEHFEMCYIEIALPIRHIHRFCLVTGSEEEPSPVLKTLERRAARKMPSKSLEDISSDSSSENKVCPTEFPLKPSQQVANPHIRLNASREGESNPLLDSPDYQAKVDNLPEELVRSAEDDQKADQEPDTNECIPGISTVPSQPDNQFSHPDKLKRMSKSVPAFLQDEASLSFVRSEKWNEIGGFAMPRLVSGSVMSVYSGDFGNLEVKGSIQFAVDYVDSLKELHVFVAQCKDLAAADIKKQRSDPYIKTYLLPDKGKMGKKKTPVVKKTLNPVYNEILRYKIEKQILKTQKLNVSVWHRDTFKRNSFLGEVELDLETWDWDNKQNKQLKWYPLKRKTAPVALEAEKRGEMKLALQYVPEPAPGKKLPTTGEVHIWVKECLDLPLLRSSHLNSFVKCTILPDTSRKSRQKTRAVGKTASPVFNHTMVYDGFRPEDLTEACVELTVWDHYKLTNQFLGGLRIGFGTGKSYGTEVDWMDSTPEEVALWEKMVNSPNTWIEATLPLRMLLIAKISK
ncbi:Synaptotagmin-like protein 2 [Camelus dromedarius]|uniref:Synaptotagmin-like protein 2 n=1 Tax=Camelus dromedarius TaxID=9838 RepID=A0A5N4DMP8_CAMDR|nr:Synaptotagmin-like protein 2 [Camelus dromedarius]